MDREELRRIERGLEQVANATDESRRGLGADAEDPYARISVHGAAAVFRDSIAAGYLREVDSALLFHDLSKMEQRWRTLAACFPAHALHAVAIKANPLLEVLRRLVALGAGLEAASIEEVHLALAAGCDADRIVYDSPAKTRAELAFALTRGVTINADSLEEVERIAELRKTVSSRSGVGLRINPEIAAGTISATSVGTRDSKFGVSLRSDGDRLLEAFCRFDWLEGIHVHVGSQGCELPLLIAGARAALDVCDRIDAVRKSSPVRWVDIGGGLPTEYRPDPPKPSFEEYVRALRGEAAGLFGSQRRIVTEFGRALQAGVGFAVARVEYVKRDAGRHIAILHLGADFLLREVYVPSQWQHEYAVLDGEGHPKAGECEPVGLAGPLCFSDVIEQSVSLPRIEAGDYILMRDVGAYTLSLWSRHCSRSMPRVLGYAAASADGDRSRAAQSRFTLLRERESVEDIVRFWSAQQRDASVRALCEE